MLPSLYFTKSFYNFIKFYFFKNIFRKKIQLYSENLFFNPYYIFEKKMFLQINSALSFFKANSMYYLYLKKSNKNFISKNRFFFKKSNNLLTIQSGLILKKKPDQFEILSEISYQLKLFKKSDIGCINTIGNNLDSYLFIHLFNNCLIEIYKTNIFLFFNLLNKL